MNCSKTIAIFFLILGSFLAQTVFAQSSASAGEPKILEIYTESLTPCETNSYCNREIRAYYYGDDEGCPAYTWSMESSNLPDDFNNFWPSPNSSFYLEGSSTTPGTFSFTVKVECKGLSATKTFSLRITDGPEILTSSLQNGAVGVEYWGSLEATSNDLTWSIVGSLPPGLEFVEEYGKYIQGIPTTAGTYNFAVKVENNTSSKSSTKNFSITISVPNPPELTYSMSNGVVGFPYQRSLLSGSSNGVELSITKGSLPPGLMLADWGGYIQGTPTTAGTYTFTVRAENAGGRTEREFTIEIYARLQITTTSLSDGDIGIQYSDWIGLNFGNSNIDWSITGTLPPGLEFADWGGYIQGIPTTVGTFNFTVKAEAYSYEYGDIDPVRVVLGTATQALSITIKTPPPPVITTTSLPNGKTNESYYASIYSDANATWSIVSGSLPPGLEFDNWGSGYINGTPTTVGSYTFTVEARNASGFDTKEFTIVITAQTAPVITTKSLISGIKGDSYQEWLSSTSESAVWSTIAGSLPPGLELAEWGRIEGIPTTIGSYPFTVEARNAAGGTTKQFTIDIVAPTKPEITISSLSSGMVNENFNVEIHANSNASVIWSIEGSLPPGLDVYDWGYLYIYGTPTIVGSYPITIKAENAAGIDEKVFTIEIVAQPKPVITTANLNDGTVNQYYSGGFNSSFSAIWSIVGSLPPGLELQNDGISKYAYIEGIPTAIGSYPFTVKAENDAGYDTKEFTLVIAAPTKPEITTNSIPGGAKGESYYTRLEPMSRYITWSLAEGSSLPLGLEFSNECYNYGYCIYAGVIRGTPEETGTFTFTVQAENEAGPTLKTFTIDIWEPIKPVFITKTLPSGTVGEWYSGIIHLAGSGANCSVEESSMPPELYNFNIYSFDGGCEFYGHFIEAGTFTFTVKAENGAGSTTQEFALQINAPTIPVIVTDSLHNGEIDINYYAYLESTTSGEWEISGDLPTGLVFYEWGGIEGTPTTLGTFNFTVKVTNSAGSSEPKALSITIVEAQPPTITCTSFSNGEMGMNYWEWLDICASSNQYETTWELESGSLPPGLELQHSDFPGANFTNTLSGTPTELGTFTFTLKATNAANLSATKEFTITIVAPTAPTITTASLPNGELGYAYNASLEASSLSSVEWTLESGKLPPGLSLYYGEIRGTSMQKGTFTFTLKATNETGSATKEFTITISDAATTVTITTATLPNGIVGTEYDFSLAATSPSAIWTVESGSWPPGLYFSSGRISGTPTATGTFTFTVKAENANDSDTKELTLRVFTVLPINAEAPIIATQPASATVDVGTAHSLSVAATSPDGGTLSYQWYSNATAISIGGTLIPSAADATYVAPTAVAGTFYYYVEVTNAINDNGDEGIKAVTVKSDVATVVVNAVEISSSSDTDTPSSSSDGTLSSSSGGTPSSSSRGANPVIVSRVISGQIIAKATNSAIILENLPQNANVQIYNLQGRRIYFANAENSQILQIPVQTKGLYLIKINSTIMRIMVK